MSAIRDQIPDFKARISGLDDTVEREVGTIFVVDDEPTTVEVIKTHLSSAGYTRTVATSDSTVALDLMRSAYPDVVLLDLMMPEVTGYDLLRAMSEDPVLEHIPAIVLTGSVDDSSKHKALSLGAADFLCKPVDATELILKVRNHHAAKRYADELAVERAKSEQLLAAMLPEVIRERLKHGEAMIADRYENATVLFADLVNFTALASHTDPRQVVEVLNYVFEIFDDIAATHKVEKIKTIGDAYMLAGGVTAERPEQANAVVSAALDMMKELKSFGESLDISLRIGVHSGPLVAGVIGRQRMTYDVWGDTVNVASRMESTGLPGEIQISEAVADRLADEFDLEPREPVLIRGKGIMQTYLVKGRRGA